MKYKKVTYLISLFMTVFSIGTIGYSENDPPVTVAGILHVAGCPLTDEQAKILADFTIPQPHTTQGQGGGGVGGGINSIFDAKQLEALNTKLGSLPTLGDIPARPRNLIQIILLEKAGIPLTENQIAALKAIEMPHAGQGGRATQAFQPINEQVNAIYTDAQREALSISLPQMGGGGKGRKTS